MRSIPHNNLRYPILILLKNGASGSGLFLEDKNEKCVYLVTARHVLFSELKEKENLYYNLISPTGKTISYSANMAAHERIVVELDLEKLYKDGNLKFHKQADIAVIKILNQGETQMLTIDGVKVVEAPKMHGILSVDAGFLKLYKDVTESNDAYVFGFPISLGVKDIPQIEYDKPLLRRGMISAKNDSKRTVILDCPVYPGNSGGPVIEVESIDLTTKEYRVIGVVSEFIPFVQVWKNLQLGTLNSNIENSGYSVVTPIDFALELIKEFK